MKPANQIVQLLAPKEQQIPALKKRLHDLLKLIFFHQHLDERVCKNP